MQQVIVRSLEELNGLVEQHVFGHEIEWRYCQRDYEFGDWCEHESHWSDWERSDFEKLPNFIKYPCWKEISKYDYENGDEVEREKEFTTWYPAKEYACDINDAWELIDHLREKGWSWRINIGTQAVVSSNLYKETNEIPTYQVSTPQLSSQENLCINVCTTVLAEQGINVIVVLEEEAHA